MSDIARLRAMALGFRREFSLDVCLDLDKRGRVDQTVTVLQALLEERQAVKNRGEGSGRRSIADETSKLDDQIAAAEKAVEAAEQDAYADSVKIVWLRRTADDYDAALAQAADAITGQPDLTKLFPLVTAMSYEKTVTQDGEDMELDWPTASRLLSHVDMDLAHAGVLGMYRTGTTLDPTQRTTLKPSG